MKKRLGAGIAILLMLGMCGCTSVNTDMTPEAEETAVSGEYTADDTVSADAAAAEDTPDDTLDQPGSISEDMLPEADIQQPGSVSEDMLSDDTQQEAGVSENTISDRARRFSVNTM